MAGEADSSLELERETAEPVPALFSAASLAGAAALLASCGGGGGGGGSESSTSPAPPASAAPAPPTVVLPTRLQASRFLGQAAMGASRADVDRVASVGFDAWLESQFNMPRETTHWDWLVANGYTASANVNGVAGFDPVMWRQLIASPDQLRQRVTMALLDILVVGIDGFNSFWRQFAMAAYVDLLADNAFGNFRTLLQQVSQSVAMGYFLTFINNRKANPATGALPDENYARELMQLFTIGLLRLNPDGTVQTSNGQPVETYTQADIAGLARVFTGFVLDSADNSTPDRMRRPMAIDARYHETGAKTFLGVTIPAGTSGAESLKIALETIFAHPNVAPFISRQLIQRLVTSNPSPAYVTRISTVFENNGSGVRGDLRAVVRAILLDFEARTDVATPSFGKLRAPMQRLTGWARAFGATSPSNAWAIGDTSSSANRLGQSPGRSPSVFNFFRPGYTPPNSAIANAGLVAPEFQIANEPSVIAYVNYMAGLIVNGAGDFRPDYNGIIGLANDAASLVSEVDILLGAQLGAATRQAIAAAVDAISFASANGPLNRVHTAILLTLASPDYLVQK
jgi:uncharacterized protein (DUF1800 family)